MIRMRGERENKLDHRGGVYRVVGGDRRTYICALECMQN